nr:MAG TPA: hypothetical protein [Caudoviricetes sp.]
MTVITPNIRLLNDHTEYKIRSLRNNLHGRKLDNFDADLKNTVDQALAFAKNKVANRAIARNINPGLALEAVKDYGKKLREIIDPIVSRYLNIA